MRRLRSVGCRVRRTVDILRRGRHRTDDDLQGVRGDDGVLLEPLLRLLFPTHSEHVPRDLMGELVPDGVVRESLQIRRILGAVEHQATPSPVTIRFGPEDVAVRDFGSFQLLLDRADAALSVHLLHQAWEPHTTRVMTDLAQPGMTVIDVGANIGWFTMLAASRVGPSGSVIAVEPLSENCRLILGSALMNRFEHVELWPFGLDSHRGWSHFSSHVGSNGGLTPGSHEDLMSGRGMVIPVFALDEILPAERQVHVVKIDVEGAEHRVVAGAQQTLTRWRPTVISEFSLEMSGRVSGIDPIEYLRWFTMRGWELHVVDRSGSGLRPFSTPEELLAWWPAYLHHEDLLFVPR